MRDVRRTTFTHRSIYSIPDLSAYPLEGITLPRFIKKIMANNIIFEVVRAGEWDEEEQTAESTGPIYPSDRDVQ